MRTPRWLPGIACAKGAPAFAGHRAGSLDAVVRQGALERKAIAALSDGACRLRVHPVCGTVSSAAPGCAPRRGIWQGWESSGYASGHRQRVVRWPVHHGARERDLPPASADAGQVDPVTESFASTCTSPPRGGLQDQRIARAGAVACQIGPHKHMAEPHLKPAIACRRCGQRLAQFTQ